MAVYEDLEMEGICFSSLQPLGSQFVEWLLSRHERTHHLVKKGLGVVLR
jgi:hypothetical protein